MASFLGRAARIVTGLILVAIGLYLKNTWGIVISIAGIAPLPAGIFSFGLFGPLLGGPSSARRLVAKT
ncbi:MAG: DUF2892 domain-containing protein [Candidatus Dormibacteraceae bacterium]